MPEVTDGQPSRTGALLWRYGLALVILILDQATKLWATAQLDYAQPVEVTPFFNLTLLHNTGAAFSFLSEAGGWQTWFFAIVAVAVSLAIVVWLWRLPQQERLQPTALALILGGAVGNLWDRLAQGYVVDFLDFYVGNYHWPAFNIADAAIVVGAVIMIWQSFRDPYRRDPHPRDPHRDHSSSHASQESS